MPKQNYKQIKKLNNMKKDKFYDITNALREEQNSENKTPDTSPPVNYMDWWADVKEEDAAVYRMQYFKTKRILTDIEIEFIYKAEHPETKEEVGTDVSIPNFTGRWFVENFITNPVIIDQSNMDIIAEIVTGNFTNIDQAKANAQRIVLAVNNFDAMYKALNKLLLASEGASTFLQETGISEAYLSESIREAKEVLNSITPPIK